MPRFENINYPEFGEYVRALIADKDKVAKLREGNEADLKNFKEELKGFMTPRDGVSWDEITVYPHFDTATVVHLAFPFTGEVEASIAAFAPSSGDGESYVFPPDFYLKDPNEGKNEAAKQETRVEIYLQRIADYVMARCK